MQQAMEANMLGTAQRRPIDRVQPASLAGSVMYSTPIGQRSMRLGGGGGWPTRRG